jgi:plasmid stability protein
MRRTLIQLDEDTYRKLRQHAFRHERSISSVVRELVASGLEGGHRVRRRSRVSQFASVGSGRSKQDRRAPISERHDEALAAAFKK